MRAKNTTNNKADDIDANIYISFSFLDLDHKVKSPEECPLFINKKLI